jgi:sugar lactone lactonase YvrE
MVLCKEGTMSGNLVLAAEDVVGESIVWDAARARLVWVDIIGRRIHALDPATGAHQIWPIAGRPTSIGLCANGGAIMGMERHICLWDWQATPVPVVEVEPDQPCNRLNEGVVGPDGAFWVGTMRNNINDDDSPRDILSATGSIHRYTIDGGLRHVCKDRFGITNTFAFPSRHEIITADTLANKIYAYQIGPEGDLSARRELLSGFPRGLPDGSCLDAEGRLWTARVCGGGCLTCITPDGRVERVVELPCSWPTSCTFGGPDFSTLYVTSARFTMTPEHLAAHPEEGALFGLDIGIQGRPANLFGAQI